MRTKNKIQITFITGYLGSGKTTLIQKILNEPHGRKTAVLVNEFAEVGIDKEIMQSTDFSSSKIVELANGCLCCVMQGEFKTALQDLNKNYPEVEWVIIETSGAADPATSVKLLWGDPEITAHFRLDGSICVVDSTRIEALLENNPLVLKQIMIADRILLSKTDRVNSTEKTDLLISKIKQRNSWASIVACDLTKPKSLFMNENRFWCDEIFPLRAYSDKKESFFKILEPAFTDSKPTHTLQSFSRAWNGILSPAGVQKFFRTLLSKSADGATVLRLKAILHVYDPVQKRASCWLIQGVEDWIEKTEITLKKPNDNPLNRLMVLHEPGLNASRLDMSALSR